VRKLIDNRVSRAAVAVALLAAPAVAHAQDAGPQEGRTGASGGEIIVTAQRREEKSVDVPITITTLGAEALETANARDLSDISKVTPGLRFDFASSFMQPTIRGIGTAVATSGGGSNVGIYIDGFYSPNPVAANMNLMNVQSVQVLKGPQGTLFGRNTTGGAILIQTAEPSEEAGGKFKLSYGRFNAAEAQFYGTMGIAPGVAFDVEGLARHGDGFQTNILTNDDKVSEYTEYSVRAGLKVELGDSASLLLRYMHSESDNPGPVNANTYIDPVLGIGSPYFLAGANGLPPASLVPTDPDLIARGDPAPFVTIRSDVVQATLKVDLGFADLTSYTQWRSEVEDQSLDLDWTGFGLFQLGIPVTDKTLSQEVLLTSKPGTPLQWTAGLYYLDTKDSWLTFIDNFGIVRDLDSARRLGGSGTRTRSMAAFIDATYELTPQVFITAGARYAHDEVKDAYWNAGTTRIPVPSIKNNKVTPRFVVRYKPTEESSIYASYTMGYKAGIIDVGGSCQRGSLTVNTCNPVQPEKVNAFEIGAKYDNRTVSLELSGFYYDYKNLQVSVYKDNAQASITNAASSEIYGLEGSARVRLGYGFEVSAGASWTHARYKRFENAPLYFKCGQPECGIYTWIVASGITLKDVPMQRTPEFTGNIGMVYRTDLGGGELQFSSNLYYTSKFYFGPSGTQFPQEGFETLSARVQWTDSSGAVTLGIWGDNITNNRHLNAVQYNSFGLGASWNSPVTYGADATFRF